MKKTPSGDGFIAKIADFGISKYVDNQTHLSTQVGTPSYMAPEVHKGEEYSYPCDVYSLGVILCQMMTNKLDVRMENLQKIKNKNVLQILKKCLEEKPNERWKIQTVIEALEKELGGFKIQIQKPTEKDDMLSPKVPIATLSEETNPLNSKKILMVENVEEIRKFNGDRSLITKIILKQARFKLFERKNKTLPKLNFSMNKENLDNIRKFLNLEEIEIVMDQIVCLDKQEILDLNNLLENLPLVKVTLFFCQSDGLGQFIRAEHKQS